VTIIVAAANASTPSQQMKNHDGYRGAQRLQWQENDARGHPLMLE
jgi:hypothetical protein